MKPQFIGKSVFEKVCGSLFKDCDSVTKLFFTTLPNPCTLSMVCCCLVCSCPSQRCSYFLAGWQFEAITHTINCLNQISGSPAFSFCRKPLTWALTVSSSGSSSNDQRFSTIALWLNTRRLLRRKSSNKEYSLGLNVGADSHKLLHRY